MVPGAVVRAEPCGARRAEWVRPRRAGLTDTRRLPFYRGIVVVLLVALAAVGWRTQQLLFEVEALTPPPAAPPASPPAPASRVEVTHLDERITALVAANPTSSDLSETYLVSDHATVHMHLMAPRQTCPLHLHRRSHEATIIVDGTAEVTGEGTLADGTRIRPRSLVVAGEPVKITADAERPLALILFDPEIPGS